MSEVTRNDFGEPEGDRFEISNADGESLIFQMPSSGLSGVTIVYKGNADADWHLVDSDTRRLEHAIFEIRRRSRRREGM